MKHTFSRLFIVGPTASGKTELSLKAAELFDGEIICADSQTVYKDLNIGTAKPSHEEQKRVPHHMIDILEPKQVCTAAFFSDRAKKIISEITARGKLPIIVGGSGLYVDSLLYNYSHIPPNYALRQQWSEATIEQLQAELKKQLIPLPENHQNKRHLLLALERKGARPTAQPIPDDIVMIGILPDKEVLVERINRRVDLMFANGFLDEVEYCMKKYSMTSDDFDAIGYKIVAQYFEGSVTLDDAKERFKMCDRRYAKRQMTWFKRNKKIQWFTSGEEAFAYLTKPN